MKSKRIFLFVMAFMIVEGMLGIWLMRKPVEMELDIVEVNDLIQTYQTGGVTALDSIDQDSICFGIYDSEGTLIYRNNHGLAETLDGAIQYRDTMIDMVNQSNGIEKFVVYNSMLEDAVSYQQQIFFIVSAVLLLELLFMVGYFYYVHHTYMKPFVKLQEFASRVAGGDLDFPLAMDRSHAFGAFTESFDLMREELKKAKLQELAANQSKKELVAKLSHDIKTPVASIQAVSELMVVQTSSDKEKQQLTIIQEKANQIDRLISDLFHATLEELQELPVYAKQQDSRALKTLLTQADYQHRAQIEEIPQCLLWYDEQRLQQVFDNVFANSYKYANGDMQVSFTYESKYLLILIRDDGCSVEAEELPRLFDKYYRGKNGDKKSGAGLGLYISRYFIEQMGGYMEAYQHEDGFCMHIALALV